MHESRVLVQWTSSFYLVSAISCVQEHFLVLWGRLVEMTKIRPVMKAVLPFRKLEKVIHLYLEKTFTGAR